MPPLPSLLASATEALFAAQRGTVGRRTVKIDGREYERLGDAIESSPIETHGAEGESATVTFSIRIKDCPRRPHPLAEVVIGDLILAVLSSSRVNGILWEIIAGDPGIE